MQIDFQKLKEIISLQKAKVQKIKDRNEVESKTYCVAEGMLITLDFCLEKAELLLNSKPNSDTPPQLNKHDVSGRSELLPVAEILDMAQPWPLPEVLNKLIEATEILLHKKNYDGHGWEEIHYAVEKGKQFSLLFKGNCH